MSAKVEIRNKSGGKWVLLTGEVNLLKASSEPVIIGGAYTDANAKDDLPLLKVWYTHHKAFRMKFLGKSSDVPETYMLNVGSGDHIRRSGLSEYYDVKSMSVTKTKPKKVTERTMRLDGQNHRIKMSLWFPKKK